MSLDRFPAICCCMWWTVELLLATVEVATEFEELAAKEDEVDILLWFLGLFRRLANPFPTWMDISAVLFPLRSSSLEVMIAWSSSSLSFLSMEHCIPMVHFSGITLPQVQMVCDEHVVL